jgi:hypothetical protein
MPLPRFRPLSAAALVLALLAGGAALAYAGWTRPLVEADAEARDGRAAAALAGYARAERRFGRFEITRMLFARQYSAAVANQLALLYRAGDYDAVIDKAAASPASAAPHFWSGLALMRLGMAEGRRDAQQAWFTRAEEELKQALDSAPGDWDTKVNYEIAARVLAEMRRQPKRAIENPLQLLRPQPAQTTPQRKVG